MNLHDDLMAGLALQLLHIILVETNRFILWAGVGDSFVKTSS
jgi:hypothetical protein